MDRTRSGADGRVTHMQETRAAPAILEAVLERITYANPETGYTVARVATNRSSDLAHGGRAAAGGPARREPTPAGPLDQPPSVRPPIPGRDLHHRAARDHPGDPPLPRLGADQGDRPQDGRADRRPLRPRHPGGDRAVARAAGRGARPWPQTHQDDHRRLGRAAGHQGGDGLPAGRWGVHVAWGADLQDLPG
jgi:hypothetical protein